MTKEELKRVLLTHLNLDNYERAEIDRFFEVQDGITVENFTQLFNEWRESDDGKKTDNEILQIKSIVHDVKIQKGLTSISRGNYHKVRPDLKGRFGANVVVDNATKLRGLVSDDNEEILPCIFDNVNVTLSAFIETTFNERYYEFSIMLSKDYRPSLHSDDYDFNGVIWHYRLRPNKEIDNYKGKGRTYAYVELDETTQQLISLLNMKHATKQE